MKDLELFLTRYLGLEEWQVDIFRNLENAFDKDNSAEYNVMDTPLPSGTYVRIEFNRFWENVEIHVYDYETNDKLSFHRFRDVYEGGDE